MKAHILPIAVVITAALPLVGCGASLQAVYEGDVRFERCMALDVQPQVQADARRDCWKEWVAYYTYGQTRDRVLHAQLRIKQLSGQAWTPPSDEPKSDLSQADRPLEGPSPETALAPPPMMSKDPTSGDNSPDDAAAQCLSECQAVQEQCGRSCNDAPCLSRCSSAQTSCTRRCS
jgi:hypothetical protein